MPRSSGKPRPHRWIRDRNKRAQAALADAGGLVAEEVLAVEEEVVEDTPLDLGWEEAAAEQFDDDLSLTGTMQVGAEQMIEKQREDVQMIEEEEEKEKEQEQNQDPPLPESWPCAKCGVVADWSNSDLSCVACGWGAKQEEDAEEQDPGLALARRFEGERMRAFEEVQKTATSLGSIAPRGEPLTPGGFSTGGDDEQLDDVPVVQEEAEDEKLDEDLSLIGRTQVGTWVGRDSRLPERFWPCPDCGMGAGWSSRVPYCQECGWGVKQEEDAEEQLDDDPAKHEEDAEEQLDDDPAEQAEAEKEQLDDEMALMCKMQVGAEQMIEKQKEEVQKIDEEEVKEKEQEQQQVATPPVDGSRGRRRFYVRQIWGIYAQVDAEILPELGTYLEKYRDREMLLYARACKVHGLEPRHLHHDPESVPCEEEARLLWEEGAGVPRQCASAERCVGAKQVWHVLCQAVPSGEVFCGMCWAEFYATDEKNMMFLVPATRSGKAVLSSSDGWPYSLPTASDAVQWQREGMRAREEMLSRAASKSRAAPRKIRAWQRASMTRNPLPSSSTTASTSSSSTSSSSSTTTEAVSLDDSGRAVLPRRRVVSPTKRARSPSWPLRKDGTHKTKKAGGTRW